MTDTSLLGGKKAKNTQKTASVNQQIKNLLTTRTQRHHQSPDKMGGMNESYKMIAANHGLQEGELKALLSSMKGKPPTNTKVGKTKATKTKRVKFLSVTDTHIGHEKFNYGLWDQLAKDAKDVEMVIHSGDHLEGMSGRPGHIYELECVGYKAQINRARELYSMIEKPIYGIDGNHDQWFKQKNNAGVVVGEELAMTLKNFTHLGEWEGTLDLDGLKLLLFHANDGTAYATSYKSQKLVESFSGGEKPHIVLSGHYHKALYHFTRNVHAFESGTICGQSRFMRGKKLAAHMGYWIVDVTYNETGVTRLIPEFVPGYE